MASVASSGSTKAANAAWPLPGSSARICPLLQNVRRRARNGGERCGIFSTLLGFRQALVDHAEQRHRLERLAQAPRRAEAKRHPEPALLEPYAYGKAGVQVVIDHQDATQDPPPSWRGRAQCALSAIPAEGKRTSFHTIARTVLPCKSVHYRISAANRRSVCPPQCIRSVPQPGRPSDREFMLGPSTRQRRTIVDARRSICRGRCKRHCALSIVAGSGVRIALPASRNSLGGARRQIGADQCDVVAARPPSSSTRISSRRRAEERFENIFSKAPISKSHQDLARHEQPPVDATPGDLLRANASHPVEPRSSRRLLHGGIVRRRGKAADPAILRGRSTAAQPRLDRGARVSAGALRQLQPRAIESSVGACGTSSAPYRAVERIAAPARRTWPGAHVAIGPTRRRLLRLFCPFLLANEMCKDASCHFGLHALDARDRLGP